MFGLRLVVYFFLAFFIILTLILFWDEKIISWLYIYNNTWFGNYFGEVTYWAGLGGIQLFIIFFLILFGRIINFQRLVQAGIFSLYSIIIVGVITQLFKYLIGRPRPRLGLPVWAYFGPSLANELHSFPSGHAATSIAIAVIFGSRFPSFAWIFYTFAILVCLGRIISESHYLSDVFGGTLVGLVISWFLTKYFFPIYISKK